MLELWIRSRIESSLLKIRCFSSSIVAMPLEASASH
jgi:hypothetical protein